MAVAAVMPCTALVPGLTRTPWWIFLNCRCSAMMVVGATVVNVKVSDRH